MSSHLQPGGPPNGSQPYLIGIELTTPNMLNILAADELYITPALYELSDLYGQQATETIDNFQTFLLTFVPSFMGAFVCLVAFSFLPNIRRVNQDIITKRTMLLYLPAPIVARTATIRALIDEILARDAELGNGSGGGGSGVRGGG